MQERLQKSEFRDKIKADSSIAGSLFYPSTEDPLDGASLNTIGVEKRSQPVPFPSQQDAEAEREAEQRKKAMETEMDRLKRELAKQKMAVIKSKADLLFSAAPGDLHELSWTVQNQSTEPWPTSIELKEVNSGKAQKIEKVLGPNDQTDITYTFDIDLFCTE